MDGGDDATRAIRHQQRHTVSGADGNGDLARIRYQRIRVGPRLRHRRSSSNDDDLSSMHLVDHCHVARTDGFGKLTNVSRRGQLQLPCREQMRCDRCKRTASQRGAPGLFGPLETV
jgi:hypothetical protein